MKITVRVLGLELLHLAIDTDDSDESGPGDYTATGTTFLGFHVDPRWQPGLDP